MLSRIKEIFAPSYNYCVTLNCQCGETVFWLIIRAKSPEHAKTKTIDYYSYLGIHIPESISIEVEQI